MKSSGIRHLTAHDPKLDYHEMIVWGDMIWRDKAGRRKGGTWLWLVLKCNDPDCPGEAIIRTDRVTALLDE